MRPRGPPCQRVRTKLPLRLPALEVTVVAEGQYLSSTALALDRVREIIRHAQVADAEKPVDALTTLIRARARAVDRREVIESEMQELAWAVAVGHFGWTVEAVELEFRPMLARAAGVVLPHPFDELAIGVKPAEPVAEA